MGPSPQEVTQPLQAWRQGDASALDKLMPLVYDELRRAARAQMARQAPGSTLQTTALINEVYLRLVGSTEVKWQDRAHFIAFCATVMRNILVDHFRRRRRQTSLGEAEQLPQDQEVGVLKLHEALESLAAIDRRGSQVVELRFFGGLSFEEVAEVLDISIATAKRDWQKARAWLYRELSGRP
jgi:RNA polymerase sigma factor (TIGR02999 family)